jgi:glyoxylase-like metal-dependent hydrolase (beta-lactamase superfamily II)
MLLIVNVRVNLQLLAVGHCRHCERVTMVGGGMRIITFPSICALIVHPREGAILYDTGYADHFLNATARLPERAYRWLTPVTLPAQDRLGVQLARLGVALGDIRWCVLSHLHADHIAGVRDLPAARFIASRQDVADLRSRSRLGGLLKGLLPKLLPPDFDSRLQYAEALPQRAPAAGWEALGDGFDLFGDDSVLAVPLAGHTPGHLGLLLRDQQDRRVLLCADAAWSRRAWQEQRLPSLLARPLVHDWQAYQRTLHTLHELAARHSELAILPSHCQASLDEYHRMRGP